MIKIVNEHSNKENMCRIGKTVTRFSDKIMGNAALGTLVLLLLVAMWPNNTIASKLGALALEDASEIVGNVLVLHDEPGAENLRVHTGRNPRANNEHDMSRTGRYLQNFPHVLVPGEELIILPDVSGLDPAGSYKTTGLAETIAIGCPGGVCFRNNDGQISIHIVRHDGTIEDDVVAPKVADLVNSGHETKISLGSRPMESGGESLALKGEKSGWAALGAGLIGKQTSVTEGVGRLREDHGVEYHQGTVTIKPIRGQWGGKGDSHQLSFVQGARKARPTIVTLSPKRFGKAVFLSK